MSDDSRRALRRRIVRAALVALGALVFLQGLHLAAGLPFDAATFALVACALALLHALARLRALARALGRPFVQSVLRAELDVAPEKQRELRDEKRRLLRAIKELDFDHGIGKLSDQDHAAVLAAYKLRAIEVMRALDAEAEIHPELAAVLRRRHGGEGQTCPACAGRNDPDARFCKHCGHGLSG